MNELKTGLIVLAIFLSGCVDVGGSSTGVDVCSGDAAECGDHDESDNSVNPKEHTHATS
jgi:hypothetical protein